VRHADRLALLGHLESILLAREAKILHRLLLPIRKPPMRDALVVIDVSLHRPVVFLAHPPGVMIVAHRQRGDADVVHPLLVHEPHEKHDPRPIRHHRVADQHPDRIPRFARPIAADLLVARVRRIRIQLPQHRRIPAAVILHVILHAGPPGIEIDRLRAAAGE
jgi:hypothetical protein